MDQEKQLWAISWGNHGGEGTGSVWGKFDDAADQCQELSRKYPGTDYTPRKVVPCGSRGVTKGEEVFLKNPDDCPEGVVVMYWCALDSAPHIGYRNKKALADKHPYHAWVSFGSVPGWSHEDVLGWIFCPTPVTPMP